MSEVLTVRTGGVLELALNRPGKKNALTGAMYRTLIAGLIEAEADDSIGVVLLRAEGGMFSAGNDIADFAAAALSGEEIAAVEFIRRIARFQKPVVAAVEGLAVGVGVTMLLHCDLVYVAPDASFSMPFTDLGLLPEAGSSLLLPRRAGMARASAWLLLGETFSAHDALAAGLVNAILPREELLGNARAKAAALAAKPRAALLEARRFLRGDQAEIDARIEAELVAFRRALSSPAAAAAIAGFLNKKK
jgi:enoyl-CoA hydratase/carnithine racemase